MNRQIAINALAMGMLTIVLPHYSTWQFWWAMLCGLILIVNSMVK